LKAKNKDTKFSEISSLSILGEAMQMNIPDKDFPKNSPSYL